MILTTPETCEVPGDIIEAIGEPDYAIGADDVRRLLSPMLYALLGPRGVEYVGMSVAGISRPLSPTHNRIGRGTHDADHVLGVWVAPPGVDLALVEDALIRRIRPARNGRPHRIYWSPSFQLSVAEGLDLFRLRSTA